jgi:dimethylhistidine N-methyltransferase
MTAFKAPAILINPIAEEVLAGLSARHKTLPPKLFYDAAGSDLFDQITETAEYYPTRTERDILTDNAGEIISQAGNNLTLVELGAGSATKTQVLIAALLRRQLRAEFYPVDVSSSALQGALTTLNGHFPRCRVSPIVADYTHQIPDLSAIPGRKLVLFIGSTIGNFEPEEALAFLKNVHAALKSSDAKSEDALQPSDALLIGFDLIKDADVLHAAYNDAQGVTAAFNKNILAHINRGLGGNFDLNAFAHVAFWNPRKSRIEMHLESQRDQTVSISDLGRSFHFAQGERIHTENSYKFTTASMRKLLRRSGFKLEKNWTDEKGWFGEALARV